MATNNSSQSQAMASISHKFTNNPQTSLSPQFKTKALPLPSSRILCTSSENNETKQSLSSAGKIKRLVLPQEGRTKLNTYPDRDFYAYPRFVTHVDDGFISTLTNLYRQKLRPNSEILDLMSSWVSHLPEEVEYKKVVGHGLNAQELAKNPRLDYFFVKDLNQDQKLELESSSFDAVLCTVSVQYLQQPDPNGGGGGAPRNKSPFSWVMGLLGLLSGSDPFYAVIAYKNFKPVYE